MTHCRVPGFAGLGSAIRARRQRSVADRGRWAWAVGALAIGLPLPAEGQSTGTVSGLVTDTQGLPLAARPGIRPRDRALGVVTNEAGRFLLLQVPAGEVELRRRSSWDTVMPHELVRVPGREEPSRWTSLWCRLPSSSTRWWSREPGGPRRSDNWGTLWRRWTPHSSPAPRSRAFPSSFRRESRRSWL